jgi:hypothetical protein
MGASGSPRTGCRATNDEGSGAASSLTSRHARQMKIRGCSDNESESRVTEAENTVRSSHCDMTSQGRCTQ